MTPDLAKVLLSTLTDPNVFGRWVGGPSWAPWRAALSAAFGIVPDDPEAVATILKHTGRQRCPTSVARELWGIIGRRGGKTIVAGVLAAMLAAFVDYRRYLVPGERGTIAVISPDRKQSRTVMRYITALFQHIPMLRKLLDGEPGDDHIDLKNGITIEVMTASYRTVRGYTLVAAVLDECAFWFSDGSANPDTEILNALRPAMATIPEALLIGISSPYARRGILWTAYREHFGVDDDPILVWQASTREMNATIPQAFIDAQIARDEAVALAEYGGQFRRDIEAFVSRETLDAAVVTGRISLPPQRRATMRGFVDTAGGSGGDSYTLGIAFSDRDRYVLAVLEEVRPPFDPNEVTKQFAHTLRTYGLVEVFGDRYAGDWPVERFRHYGVRYQHSDQNRSELYGELLPLLNSGRVELLDHQRLVNQLFGLERRTTRGGRDLIDHGPGGHDDVANAAAGAIVQLKKSVTRVSGLAVIKVDDPQFGRYDPTRFANVRDDVEFCRRKDADRSVAANRSRLLEEADRAQLVAKYGEDAVADLWPFRRPA